MNKLFIEDLQFKDKKVLMRVDFNVPLDAELNITDPTKIIASLPSIQYVLDQGGSLILMSHLGRPKNSSSPSLSLKPCAQMLSEILKKEVLLAPDCIGSKTSEMVQNLLPGNILLLENLRFHRAEEHPDEDPSFAQKIANYGDCFINDAFGSSHRRHSSTFLLPTLFPKKAAAGYLLAKEIKFLGQALMKPKRPFVALIGGSKVSSKIGVLKSLTEKVDALLIGGAMAFTFLKSLGIEIGKSAFEEDQLPIASEIISACEKKGIPLTLPIDFVVAEECSNQSKTKIVQSKEGIPLPYQGLDIGPSTIRLFSEILKKASTILWNGPVGVFEIDSFAKGTNSLAQVIASSATITVVGGGDSIAAIKQAKVEDKITHISTGGGATLEFIEYGTLPGIEALSNKYS